MLRRDLLRGLFAVAALGPLAVRRLPRVESRMAFNFRQIDPREFRPAAGPAIRETFIDPEWSEERDA